MDKYDVYQHLMNYWNETMQDDCYLIAVDGWKAGPVRILVKNKAGKETDKGWDCDLVPKTLVIDHYFLADKKSIEQLESAKETVASALQELEEAHGGEEGYFADYDKVNKVNVQKRLKSVDTSKSKKDNAEEIKVLKAYLALIDEQSDLNSKINSSKVKLDLKALNRYKTLTEDEIKQLVVDDKWMTSIERSVKTEMGHISQCLTQRIKVLAERYETPMPLQTKEVADLETKVNAHLVKMGFLWN